MAKRIYSYTNESLYVEKIYFDLLEILFNSEWAAVEGKKYTPTPPPQDKTHSITLVGKHIVYLC